VGKLADFVVLSEDPFVVPPSRLWSVTPLLTVMGGRVSWSSGKS
jgi:predicted amidohydrolase YtcJ